MEKNNIKILYSEDKDIFELEKRESLNNILSNDNWNKISIISDLKNYYSWLRNIEKLLYKIIFIWLIIVLFVWFAFSLYKFIYL